MKSIYAKCLAASTILPCLFFAGCNNTHDASKDTFKAVINSHLEKKKPICYIASAEPFPISLRDDGKSFNGSKTQLEALVTAGLLTAEKTMVEPIYSGVIAGTKFGNDATDDSKKAHPGVKYDVSPLGAKSYKTDLPPNADWLHGGAGFCLGRAEVADIEEYSEPSIGEGGMTSIVTFKYKIKQATKLANPTVMAQAFPEYGKVQKGDATMQLKLKRSIEDWEVSL